MRQETKSHGDDIASSKANREKLQTMFKTALYNLYEAFEKAYTFEHSDTIITLHCIIGSIMIPESHATVVDRNNVMSIAPDPSSEISWLNNTPSAKLKHSDFAHRKEYVLGLRC